MADLLKPLGSLALASRLKRLSDRLYRDIARTYRALDTDFEPRWFPVLYVLAHRDRLGVTELAAGIGLTHPAVNQIAAAMKTAGLLESSSDQNDQRRRLLALTARGHRLAETLMPVWNAVAGACTELLEEGGADLLLGLDGAEQALDRRSMADRVAREMERGGGGSEAGRAGDAIEIIEYRPEHRAPFRDLNLEWLQKYFRVEPLDEQVLGDPEEEIIAPGGTILLAMLDGDPVGTVALLHDGEGTRELAKMAVTERAQGRGIGRRLLQAAIDRARRQGVRTMYLETNDQLAAACHLYTAAGFVEIPDPHPGDPRYARCTRHMALEL